MPIILLLVWLLTLSAQAAPMQQIQPWLGVAVDEKVKDGVMIKVVLEQTPAEKAGLLGGDLITAVDEVKVKNRNELMEVLRSKGVGHSVTVLFKRQGKEEKKILKLEALPDSLDLLRRQLLDKPALAFELVDVADKKAIKNQDLLGKVIILEFWATWCPACRSAIPQLNRWAKKHKNISIIGVSDEPEETIKNFLKSEKVHYTMAMDTQGKIQSDYQISSIPAFILIDQKGVIRDLTLGAGDYLETLIQKAELLAAKP